MAAINDETKIFVAKQMFSTYYGMLNALKMLVDEAKNNNILDDFAESLDIMREIIRNSLSETMEAIHGYKIKEMQELIDSDEISEKQIEDDYKKMNDVQLVLWSSFMADCINDFIELMHETYHNNTFSDEMNKKLRTSKLISVTTKALIVEKIKSIHEKFTLVYKEQIDKLDKNQEDQDFYKFKGK